MLLLVRYYEGRELVSKLMSVFVGLSILLLRQERELNSKPVVLPSVISVFLLSDLGSLGLGTFLMKLPGVIMMEHALNPCFSSLIQWNLWCDHQKGL